VRFSDGSAAEVSDIAEALERRGLRVLSRTPHDLMVEAAGVPLEVELTLSIVARKAGDRYLGTGPFVVTAQLPDRLVLGRVVAMPGRIQRVEFIPCATGREALVRLLRGELGAIPSLDPAHAELLEGVPGVRVIRGSAPYATTILLNPRLPAAERRALARAIPVEEIAAAVRREPCCGGVGRARAAIPAGRPLTIGYPHSVAFRRAALALRQTLGSRGGDLQAVEVSAWPGSIRDFDLVAVSMVVRPPGILANYLRSGAEWNWMGYSNARYDAALAVGDEAAAAEALSEDPAVLEVARRERVAAVDARMANARLGDWGIFELLPEWELSP